MNTPESAPSENPAPEGSSAAENSSPAPVVVTGAHSSDALRVGDLKARDVKESGASAKTRPHLTFFDAFLPNRALRPSAMAVIIAVEVAIFLALWVMSPYKVLPQPGEVLAELQKLWMTQGLGQDLARSFNLNFKSLVLASLVSLGLAYVSVIPIFRPITAAVAKARFLSMVGLTVILTLTLKEDRKIQTAMMVFGVTVFYVTSMASVVAAIPKEQFDHARTLRMSEWRVVWEVVILGTADKALDVLRQNAAIGWMMLTMVEGLVRSQGGVGVALLNQQKYTNYAGIYAIQFVILAVGILQDYGIVALRRFVCPYADLTLERK